MVILLALFGLLIGSFVNVIIFRVPRKISLISPPSTCPKCRTAIRKRDNIPLLSWILLHGKCRTCGLRISIRYPIVELATAIFFGVVGLKFSGPLIGIGKICLLLAFLYLAAISVALTLIDLETHTLPNWIVLPSYGVGIVLLGGASLANGNYSSLLRALFAAFIMWAIYLAIALSYPGGMGFGDVKFAGVLGLFLGYLGWNQLITGALAAFLLGALFAIALLIARTINRKSGIPFGPWMMAGAWVGVLFSAPIVQGYFSLMGLNPVVN